MGSKYNDFCGGPFWNTTHFLSGSWPQFSPCFTSICLVWIPCGLLFLVAPWYLQCLRHRHVMLRLPFSRINAAKLICQLSILICTFVLLLKRNGQKSNPGSSMSNGEILSYVIKIVAFMLLVAIGQYERKKSVTASMLQFTFWTVYTLGQVIPAFTIVKLKLYQDDTLRFVLFFLSFGFSMTLTLLNCWSEHPGVSATRRGYMQFDEQDPCPLDAASTMSSLTFSWIFELLKTASRHDIDDSTMWTVPTGISSEETSGHFDRLWKEEVDGYYSNHQDWGHSYGMAYSRRSRRGSNCSSISTSTSTNTSTSTTTNSNNSNNSNSYNNNSINAGSIVSKATVMENRMYTEKTRLTDKTESSHTSQYTQLAVQNTGVGIDLGLGLGKTLGAGRKHQQPSLLRSLWKLYRGDIAVIVVTKLFGDVLTILIPLILRFVLVYQQLGDHQRRPWQGYGLCVLFLLVLQCQCFLGGRCQLLAVQSGVSINSVLTTAIYKKVLTLRSNRKSDPSTDDCVRLITTDCLHVQEFLARLAHTVTTPLLILMVVAVTYTFMGPAALIGVSSLCLLVPVRILLLLVQAELRNHMATNKECRTRLLHEIVTGIKVVKLFAWEVPFQSKVRAIRSMEISSLFKLAYSYMVSETVNYLDVYLAALVTFGSFILNDQSTILKPESAFMVLAYLFYLRTPLEKMAGFVHLLFQTYKSCTRIHTFLLRDELCEDAVAVTPGAEHPIKMEDALLKWDASSSFKFKHLSLTVPQESLTAIVGPEGCGKSSLLAAMLGEMDKLGGNVTRRGTVAYTPQEPWTQNDSLRENITFGRVYRERKVKAVVSACQLEEELTSIGADEDTVIGQHGVSLDQSQERRVSLARALYHDCDLYLLDEPLSGLGPRVGRAVFSHVMGPKGLLKHKTRIITTNCLHILPAMDTIVVMSQGRVVEVGTYDGLMDHDGALVHYVKDRLIQERVDGGEESDEDEEISSIKDNMWGRVERLTTSDCTATSGDEGRLRPPRERSISCITQHTDMERFPELKSPNRHYRIGDSPQDSKEKKVSVSLYRYYLSSIGVASLTATLVMCVLCQSSWVLANVWLAQWTWDLDLDLSNMSSSVEVEQTRIVGNQFYLSVFLLFGVGQFLFLGCFHFLFWTAIVRACRGFHDVMIERLFRAPFAFFNATPLGNIFSVFSGDIDVIDHTLPHHTNQLVWSCVQLVGVVTVISVATPMFLVVILPATVIFGILMKLYVPTSKQLHHLARRAQSPVNNHFCDTLLGATTIRAFHEEERFLKEFSRHVDSNNSYNFGFKMAHRWVTFHLTTLSNILVFVLIAFQVMFSHADPGLAGVAIFYALQLPSLLGRLMSAISGIETDIGAGQAIKQYSEIPQEADRIKPDSRPAATWPFPGDVEFHEFSAGHLYERERQQAPPLKDICIRMGGGEKIGIISRAGKEESYLPLSMFRLVERSKGAIFIDGVDIASIGVHDLRNKLTILPQEPVLFSGSLRFNLDPLGEFKDDQIWSSLARVHLKPYVAQLEDRLAFDVGYRGRNLSAGYRQLVCLARTLLRKTSVLVVEESCCTSGSGVADCVQPDHQFINNIVRMAFQRCTTITVTQRPQSIVNCDRVVVLEGGCVKEFDSPLTLLKSPTSIFYSISRDAGLIL